MKDVDPNGSLLNLKYTEDGKEWSVIETTSWDTQLIWVLSEDGEASVRKVDYIREKKSAAS